MERAISDFQRRGCGWTSKCDNRKGTRISSSLKRDEIAQIGWLTIGENFVSKRDQFLFYAVTWCLAVNRFKNRSGV